MPAFFSHYRFGFYSYKRMSKRTIKTSIKNHPHVFALGCQGPDLFFYNIGNYIDKLHNFANRVHDENTGDFFRILIDIAMKCSEVNIEKYQIMLAYSAGFLAHYCLDSKAHPFVYSMVGTEKGKYFTGKHFQFESDIDLSLLKQLENKKPSDYDASSIVSLSQTERKTVARQLAMAVTESLGDVYLSAKQCEIMIGEMAAVLLLLKDKNGLKGKAGDWIENQLFGYPFCSPLFYNDISAENIDPCNEEHQIWLNPFSDKLCTESYFDLFDEAKEDYLRIINIYDSVINGDTDMSVLLDLIGNRSYKTGLEQ